MSVSVGREGGNRSRQKRVSEHANTCMCVLVHQGTDNTVTDSVKETVGWGGGGVGVCLLLLLLLRRTGAG